MKKLIGIIAGFLIVFLLQTIAVSAGAVNNTAPLLNLPSQITVDIDDVEHYITLADKASDADGDPLTFTLEGESDASIVDCRVDGDRLYYEAVSGGDATCTVKADDGFNGTIVDSVTFTSSNNILQISKVRVTVDGKSETVTDGETINDVQPGSTLKVSVEVKNNYPNSFGSDSDYELDDILVETTIEGVDDGDDLDEDDSTDNLRPGRDKTVSMTFEIPEKLDTEDTYDVTIFADGEDGFGNTFSDSFAFEIEIQREQHDVRITRADVTPSILACGTKRGRLDITIENYGERDEDEILIRVWQTDIGILETYSGLTLDADSDDKIVKSIPFDATKLTPGEYKFEIEAYYDTSHLDSQQSAYLTINECTGTGSTGTGSTSTGSTGTGSTGTSQGNAQDLVHTEIIYTGKETTNQPVTQPTTLPETKPFTESPAYLFILIFGVVLMLILVVLMIASNMRNR